MSGRDDTPGAPSEELFDVVDDQGRVVGRAPRSRCHGDPSLVHRAVHVQVFDSAGRLYLQRRSPDKDVQPGKWDSSVGGHVALGETYREAAVREMQEELGLTGLALQHLHDWRWRTGFESEDIRTYKVVYDGPIHPDPAEISEGRFWSREEIRASLGKDVFTPNFEQELVHLGILKEGSSAPGSESAGPDPRPAGRTASES